VAETMKIERVYIGGWFQKTMIHLTEMYNFLKDGVAVEGLDKKKLKDLRDAIGIQDLRFGTDGFEYVEFDTVDGINVRLHEDGLIVLSNEVATNETLVSEIDKLTSFYEQKFSPGMNYIFSLGAPPPKDLANIKTVYPYFVVLRNATNDQILRLLNENDRPKYFAYENKSLNVVRGDKFYFINLKDKKAEEKVSIYIEEQIFFREFKGQLHRYIDLHRIIWERIDAIKEQPKVRGKDIIEFTSKLDEYSKTITLIDTRINQMGTYIRTREKIAKQDKDFAEFSDIMEYRYETLGDTLAYVQHLWTMTKNYLASAKALFAGISTQMTQKSFNNLTVATSLGVSVSLIGLLTTTKVPAFTVFGVGYLLALIAIGYTINLSLKFFSARRKYEIADKEYEEIK